MGRWGERKGEQRGAGGGDVGGRLIHYLMGKLRRCTTKIQRKLGFISWVVLWTRVFGVCVCARMGREGCL